MKKNSVVIAAFTYDGDGKQVKSVVNGVTTYLAGAHYHVENGQVTKYYFAGAQRVAMRKNGTLSYMLSDHLGSTLGITNTSGTLTAGTLYKAWGETRYTLGTNLTKFKYTGQREESAIGLYFYNARWYDPVSGRFAQADTVVPVGVQGLDRYAYVNNSPIQNTDPSGYFSPEEIKKYLKNNYGDNWEKFWDAWQDDKLFWGMLLAAEIGDDLHAPTSLLGEGTFVSCDGGPFCFQNDDGHNLYEYQGQGPYILERGGLPIHTSPLEYTGNTTYTPRTGSPPYWAQPQYDYSQGYPVSTGMVRVITYTSPESAMTLSYASNVTLGEVITGTVLQWVTKPTWIPVVGQVLWGLSALSYLNEGPGRLEWTLQVSYIQAPTSPFVFPPSLEDPLPEIP